LADFFIRFQASHKSLQTSQTTFVPPSGLPKLSLRCQVGHFPAHHSTNCQNCIEVTAKVVAYSRQTKSKTVQNLLVPSLQVQTLRSLNFLRLRFEADFSFRRNRCLTMKNCQIVLLLDMYSLLATWPERAVLAGSHRLEMMTY